MGCGFWVCVHLFWQLRFRVPQKDIVHTCLQCHLQAPLEGIQVQGSCRQTPHSIRWSIRLRQMRSPPLSPHEKVAPPGCTTRLHHQVAPPGRGSSQCQILLIVLAVCGYCSLQLMLSVHLCTVCVSKRIQCNSHEGAGAGGSTSSSSHWQLCVSVCASRCCDNNSVCDTLVPVTACDNLRGSDCLSQICVPIPTHRQCHRVRCTCWQVVRILL